MAAAAAEARASPVTAQEGEAFPEEVGAITVDATPILDEARTPEQTAQWEAVWSEKAWTPDNLDKMDVLRALTFYEWDLAAAKKGLRDAAKHFDKYPPAKITPDQLENSLPTRVWLKGGHSVCGWPILEGIIENWQPWRYDADEQNRLASYVLHKMIQANPDAERVCILFDMSGFSLRHTTPHSLRMTLIFVWLAQYVFMERLGAVVCVNTPFIFRISWKVLKPIVAGRTLSRVFFLGPDYKQVLGDLINDENLPQWAGGNRPPGELP